MLRLFSYLSILLAFPLPGATLPLGSKDAIKGGTFVRGLPAYPKSLLYFLAREVYCEEISFLILESLMEFHPETHELIPRIADRWEISKDEKSFTFHINPKATFSDGHPVNAEDIAFTWDSIFNPKHNTVAFQSEYSALKGIEIIDPKTVRFTAKQLHFKNFELAARLPILAKHFYSKGDFNKDFNYKLLGSGPYLLEKVDRGNLIVFKRNPNYWGTDLAQNIGRFNFDEIIFKTVPDFKVQYEIFKRGDIDYFLFSMAKMWATETDGPLFKSGKIKKLELKNLDPPSMAGIGWNQRNPLFQDKRVRLALSHLMNRREWIHDFFYDLYVLGVGILPKNSEYQNPSIRPVEFNPKKAKELLTQAGWTQLDSEGFLIKDGKRFEFELIEVNELMLRYLTRYQEDLKKMGIKMNIRIVDWATSLKLVDDRKFDARGFSWTRDVDQADFQILWGSEEADKPGSSNFTGYKNPNLDTLSKTINETFDKKKRIPMVQKLAKIIDDDSVISWTWEVPAKRIAYWDKFLFPKKPYFNYSTEKDLYHYWWSRPHQKK